VTESLELGAVRSAIDDFFACAARGEVEIYNEFSLQHELGLHLRSMLPGDLKVQFERPVEYFGVSRAATVKREIDITVFSPDRTVKAALELKCPRNGQYPEQMFSTCVDLAFLEDLVRAGFDFGLFVICTVDALFYSGAANGPLYAAFRAGSELTGAICKPTGARDRSVELDGVYCIEWRPAGAVRYAVVVVDAAAMRQAGGHERREPGAEHA
jgi:hypothetical protein